MKSLYAFAILAIFSSVSLAHPGESELPKEPTVGDYDKAIKHYSEWSEKVGEAEFYKDIVFTKPDKKQIKFSDLPPFEQNLYFLYQAENLSNHLVRLKQFWNIELEKTKLAAELGIPDEPVKKGQKPEEKMPTQAEIEAYLVKLNVLRREHATGFEALAESVFKKYEADVPKADRENYTKQIKDWHDKQKLIDRPAPKETK